jgi:hypothetical protein
MLAPFEQDLKISIMVFKTLQVFLMMTETVYSEPVVSSTIYAIDHSVTNEV